MYPVSHETEAWASHDPQVSNFPGDDPDLDADMDSADEDSVEDILKEPVDSTMAEPENDPSSSELFI